MWTPKLCEKLFSYNNWSITLVHCTQVDFAAASQVSVACSTVNNSAGQWKPQRCAGLHTTWKWCISSLHGSNIALSMVQAIIGRVHLVGQRLTCTIRFFLRPRKQALTSQRWWQIRTHPWMPSTVVTSQRALSSTVATTVPRLYAGTCRKWSSWSGRLAN